MHRARGQAVGERIGRRPLDLASGVPRIVHRRGAGGLHAVDGERRPQLARHRERPDRLRAAADGEDQRVEARLLREDLEREGGRAGDDQRLVGRVDEAPTCTGRRNASGRPCAAGRSAAR